MIKVHLLHHLCFALNLYLGMQRFGTSFISTHQIGIPIFKAQFEEACNLLLQPSPEGTGSPDVEEAKKLYAQGKLDKAVYAMPRNRVAEKSILEFLKKAEKDGQKGVDWKGAFQTVSNKAHLCRDGTESRQIFGSSTKSSSRISSTLHPPDSKNFASDVSSCLSILPLESNGLS